METPVTDMIRNFVPLGRLANSSVIDMPSTTSA